jgi:hypothetical protein
MSRIGFAILFLAAIAVAQSPKPKGAVTVKVIDQQGNPVSEAVVRVNPPHTGAISRVSNICKTDSSGTCTRNDLPIGTYLVDAMKPEDGYPDLRFALYRPQSRAIEVVLTPGSPDYNVQFQVGPKAAKLKVNVIDDATGTSIDDPTIILRNPTVPTEMVSVGRASDSTVLIPSDKDVQVQVMANAYQSWQLTDHPELSGGKALHFRSSEMRELTIRLKHK